MQPAAPDTKDWTWTLDRRCPDCGLAAAEVEPADLAERTFIAAEEWVQILRSSPAAAERPDPAVWSPLEYGAHVRDVIRVFDDRVRQMTETDDPVFLDWDQDRAAIEGRYGELDPDEVAEELEAAAQTFVARMQALTASELARPGRRSNGSVFTVATLMQYFLHDLVHHLWDVTGQQDALSSLALEP